MSNKGLMNNLKATQQLPEAYHQIDELDLNNNRGLSMILTLTGIGLLFGVSWLLLQTLTFLRPEYLSTENILVITGMREFWRGVLLLIVSMGLMTVLYSGFRWLMFLIITHQHPTFSVRGFSAYTTAPEWRLPNYLTHAGCIDHTLWGGCHPHCPAQLCPGRHAGCLIELRSSYK